MLLRPVLSLNGFVSSSVHPTLLNKIASRTRQIAVKYRQSTFTRELHVSQLSTLVAVSTCQGSKRGSRGPRSLLCKTSTMASLTSRRPHTTSSKGKEPERRSNNGHEGHQHEHEHDHQHDHQHGHNHDGHTHSHSHSQSVFGSFAHAHSHADGGHGDAEKVIEALRGSGMLVSFHLLCASVEETRVQF